MQILFNPEFVYNSINDLFIELIRQTFDLRIECQVLKQSNSGEQSVMLRAVAEPVSDFSKLCCYISALDTDSASGWWHYVR